MTIRKIVPNRKKSCFKILPVKIDLGPHGHKVLEMAFSHNGDFIWGVEIKQISGFNGKPAFAPKIAASPQWLPDIWKIELLHTGNLIQCFKIMIKLFF